MLPPFSQIIFDPFQNYFHFLVRFILSSANAFNLDYSYILAFGIEFRIYTAFIIGMIQLDFVVLFIRSSEHLIV